MDEQCQQNHNSLPENLQTLFWDYESLELNWERDRDLVIARVLASGSWDQVAWLRSQIDESKLRDWIESRQGAGLTPQRLRFWELILSLPHHQVDAWLGAAGRKTWDQRVQR